MPEVNVWAGIGGSHDYVFALEREYLIFADKAQDGNLSTSNCSRTMPLVDATDEQRALSAIATPTVIAR